MSYVHKFKDFIAHALAPVTTMMGQVEAIVKQERNMMVRRVDGIRPDRLVFGKSSQQAMVFQYVGKRWVASETP
jgi:hypothetical protein